jgi:hypothetical protein
MVYLDKILLSPLLEGLQNRFRGLDDTVKIVECWILAISK